MSGHKPMHGEKKSSPRKIKKRQILKREIQRNKKLAAVYFILRLFVIAVMVAQFLNRDFQNVFLCLLTLILFTLPGIIEHRFQIDVPDTLEIIILLFIFSAEILGEIREFYVTLPGWDTMLHTVNGFLAAAIGFSLVDILNREERIALSLSPFFVAVTAFCFSMTIGVIWEFFEYAMDCFFNMDMQKDTVIHTIRSVALHPEGRNIPVSIENIHSVAVNGITLDIDGYLDIGLNDTMKDLLVNFIGAAVFSVIGYFYVKSRGKGRFASRFIPRRIKRHPTKETHE